MLLQASGAFLALPDTSPAAQGEPICTFDTATLLRGERVNAPAGSACTSASGSRAIFQGASLAKPVVAALVLNLVLRKSLDLDQPLSELLPDGYVHRQNLFALGATPVVDAVPRDLLRKLSCRSLLSHTSGLPNWAASGPLQLTFEPGERWQYSGEGFVLLQHVLHTVTGKRLQVLASEELFQPLGLRHSAFLLTDGMAEALVPGHAASGKIHQLRFPFEIAAGSLYTTAPDYARFISSVIQDEHLLALVTQTQVPVPKAPNVFWGLGWGIERAADRSFIWHWGNNPGFRALAMADLRTKDAVVALSATETGMALAKTRVREVLPGPHPGLDLYLVQ